MHLRAALVCPLLSVLAMSCQDVSTPDPLLYSNPEAPAQDLRVELRREMYGGSVARIERSGVALNFAPAGVSFGEAGQGGLSFPAPDALRGKTLPASEDGSTRIAYPEVAPGMDLELRVHEGRVESYLVLNEAPPAAATGQLSFNEALSLEGVTSVLTAEGTFAAPVTLETRGAIHLRGADEAEPALTIPPPSLHDANGPIDSDALRYELTLDGDGRGMLRTLVPVALLRDPERVYPVRIDPTTCVFGAPRVAVLLPAASFPGSAGVQLNVVVQYFCGSYDYLVNWGDGSKTEGTVLGAFKALHTYANAGSYQVCLTACEPGGVGDQCDERCATATAGSVSPGSSFPDPPSTEACDPNPCQNGGACDDDGSGDFECTCATGYAGETCTGCAPGFQDNDSNGSCEATCAQAALGCVHGQCDDSSGTPTCECASGYTGTLCDEDADDCGTNLCQNGGSCVDLVGGFRCACADGYTGELCESDIDECAGDPCQNGGTCINEVGAFACDCADGFTGTKCEIEVDECSTNFCQNGATCVDLVNGYLCLCADGYTGANCDVEINECDANPCHNGGTCVDQVNGFSCICPDGFEGEECCTETDECAGDPCQNGGTCYDLLNAYACVCPDGFTGTNCELEVDECAASPCENGGTCSNGAGGFSCTCAAGYAGTTCAHCATGFQDNDGDGVCEASCANQSTSCGLFAACSDASGTVACACTEGSQDNDGDGTCALDCSQTSCEANEVCNDSSGTATCECSSGFQDNDGDGTCAPSCAVDTCGTNATCDDSSGTATCVCDPGTFDGDGDGSCGTGCAEGDGGCHPDATCVDEPGGSVRCDCQVTGPMACLFDRDIQAIFVDDDASVGGDGSSWDSAVSTVSAGLTLAGASSATYPIVFVKEGRYIADVTTGTVAVVPDGVRLIGGFDDALGGTARDLGDRELTSDVTTLTGDFDGNNSRDSGDSQVVVSLGAGSWLDGVTVTRGYNTSTEAASGVLIAGDGVTISDSIITDNRIQSAASTRARGAGLYCSGFADLRVEGSTISNNRAIAGTHGSNAQGGGLFLTDCGVDIVDSRVANNRAVAGDGDGNSFSDRTGGDSLGGGIAALGSTVLSISGGVIEDNRAEAGNGEFDDTTFGAPGGDARGGGIYNNGTSLSIDALTLDDNLAFGGSGAQGGSDTGCSCGPFGCSNDPGRTGGNAGDAEGGGLFTQDGDSTVVTGSDLTNNEANAGFRGNGGSNSCGSGASGLDGSDAGGAIYVNAGSLTQTGNSFASNSPNNITQP